MLCLRSFNWRTSSSAISNPPSRDDFWDDDSWDFRVSESWWETAETEGVSRSEGTTLDKALNNMAAVFELRLWNLLLLGGGSSDWSSSRCLCRCSVEGEKLTWRVKLVGISVYNFSFIFCREFCLDTIQDANEASVTSEDGVYGSFIPAGIFNDLFINEGGGRLVSTFKRETLVDRACSAELFTVRVVDPVILFGLL